MLHVWQCKVVAKVYDTEHKYRVQNIKLKLVEGLNDLDTCLKVKLVVQFTVAANILY